MKTCFFIKRQTFFCGAKPDGGVFIRLGDTGVYHTPAETEPLIFLVNDNEADRSKTAKQKQADAGNNITADILIAEKASLLDKQCQVQNTRNKQLILWM